MPALVILSIVAELFCCVHVVRTGRETYWIYLIIFTSWIGIGVYFITQILPEMRHSRAANMVKADVTKIIDPERDFREATQALEQLDTVENRLRMADACLARGMFDDAATLYRRSLDGPYVGDPGIMIKLADAQHRGGEYKESLETLDRVQNHNPGHQSQPGHLLYAMNLEQLGREDEALAEYAALVEYARGEEARCRYALLLQRLGRVTEAREQFQAVVDAVDRASKHYFRAEKDWYNAAKRNL